jgi:hypothetical protein
MELGLGGAQPVRDTPLYVLSMTKEKEQREGQTDNGFMKKSGTIRNIKINLDSTHHQQ